MTGECVGVIEGHKGRGIWSMSINKSNTTVVSYFIFVLLGFQLMV